MVKNNMRGSNGVGGKAPQPNDMLGWQCCMAPSLLMTEEMEQSSACVAKQVTELRQGYSREGSHNKIRSVIIPLPAAMPLGV